MKSDHPNLKIQIGSSILRLRLQMEKEATSGSEGLAFRSEIMKKIRKSKTCQMWWNKSLKKKKLEIARIWPKLLIIWRSRISSATGSKTSINREREARPSQTLKNRSELNKPFLNRMWEIWWSRNRNMAKLFLKSQRLLAVSERWMSISSMHMFMIVNQ